MNKREYGEFHKYLAYLIYEFQQEFYKTNLSDEWRTEVGEILQALEKVMKICVVGRENK